MYNIIIYNGLTWQSPHASCTVDHLGMLPSFVSAVDERPAKDQINVAYAHGGGWHGSTDRFRLNQSKPIPSLRSIQYPDESFRLIAQVQLRDELIMLFENAWVAIKKSGQDEVEVALVD